MPEPRTCADVVLPFTKQIAAARRAAEESFANFPDPTALSDLSVHPMIEAPEAAVLLTGKRWANGRTILVDFLDDPYGLRGKVRGYAERWEEDANLNFRWLGPDSTVRGEIRITFTRGGSWSYVGTDCLVASGPTLQLGWLDAQTSEEEIRRVVLHEFGHALGLGHEHSSPAAEIPWDTEKVYDYYARTQGWTRAQTDAQVLQKYAKTQTQYTRWDPRSIMQYPIPAELLTDPSKAVGMNDARSDTDSAFVRRVYPR